MWGNTFDQRLNDWYTLRSSIQYTDIETTLLKINSWWNQTPWQPYYLHWDDIENWPDPWELLNDNVFCDLSRSLGMLYTIVFLDRDDIRDANVVETQNGHNLLLVEKSRYIMNWDQHSITDFDFDIKTVNRHLSQDYMRQKYL